jgi:hypothetical protein
VILKAELPEIGEIVACHRVPHKYDNEKPWSGPDSQR